MELEKVIGKLSQLNFNHNFLELYVFGSILKSCRYQDIDILLIYQDYSELLSLKNEIQKIFPFELIHFICLTRKEESELNFIKKTSAEIIKGMYIDKLEN